MTNAESKFAVPSFSSAETASLPKPKQAKYVSKAEQASIDAYDNFVKGIDKSGKTSLVAGVPSDQSARIVMGRIRGALQRCGVEAKMRMDHEANRVYVTAAAQPKQADAAPGAPATPVAVGAR